MPTKPVPVHRQSVRPLRTGVKVVSSNGTAAPPRIRLDVRERMSGARGLFRCLRQARIHRGLWLFYLEHNLFGEARDERTRMIGHLRGARNQWRLCLGMGP